MLRVQTSLSLSLSLSLPHANHNMPDPDDMHTGDAGCGQLSRKSSNNEETGHSIDSALPERTGLDMDQSTFVCLFGCSKQDIKKDVISWTVAPHLHTPPLVIQPATSKQRRHRSHPLLLTGLGPANHRHRRETFVHTHWHWPAADQPTLFSWSNFPNWYPGWASMIFNFFSNALMPNRDTTFGVVGFEVNAGDSRGVYRNHGCRSVDRPPLIQSSRRQVWS